MPRSHAVTSPPATEPTDAWIDAYHLVAPVASGGTSAVYLAEAPNGERVALKLLDPGFAQDEAVVRSFLAELEVSSCGNHPGLIDIHFASRTCNGVPYLVMEYLDGETLQALIERVDLPPGALLSSVAQVASAAAALHHAGFIHCDLKPSNVFVLFETIDGWPRVKLIDYGVARRTTESASELISGTPSCMAPEQWRGAPTPKSDVYALGCMLYELVTGSPLFSGTLTQLAIAHCEAMPPRPSARTPNVDPTLERLIVRALAKDPALRPTMAEMANELHNLVPVVDIDVALDMVGATA